jgi:nitrate/nitrite transporter NarK
MSFVGISQAHSTFLLTQHGRDGDPWGFIFYSLHLRPSFLRPLEGILSTSLKGSFGQYLVPM